MNAKIRYACENNINNFTRKVLPIEWYPRSILLSESFAVCAISDLMKINLFIESGIYSGRSASIWSKFFDENVIIKAIDLRILQEARRNLKSYIDNKKIEIYEGNSIDLIPEILLKNTDKVIGIFLDGPKSTIAIELAEICFKNNKNVKFVALHDCYNGTIARETLKNWNITKFYTDDKEFIEEYKFLDKYEQNLTWIPYKILPDEDLKGSYGPTICVLFNCSL